MKRSKSPKRKSTPQKKYCNSTLDNRKGSSVAGYNPHANTATHTNAINNFIPSVNHNHNLSTSCLQSHQHGQHVPTDPSLLLIPCYAGVGVGMGIMEKLQGGYRNQSQIQISHPQQQSQPLLQQQYLPVTATTVENSSFVDKASSQCPRCLKRLQVPRNMKRHLESHEGNDNDRPHLCSLCDKSFKQASHAKAHLSVHNSQDGDGVGVGRGIGEMAACPVCFIEFKHGRNYKRHMLIHEGVRAYSCNLCGRRFRQAIHLKTHQVSHQTVKPHNCGQCGKSFGRVDNLRRHELIHSGLKPFSCLSCGKSYTQSHHLKSHISKCTM